MTVIRLSRPEDRERIKALTVEGFANVSIEHAIDQHWPGVSPLSWSERKWLSTARDLDLHPDGCFVAEADGEVIGYVTTGIWKEKGQGHIFDIAVDSRWRGQGIGRQLLLHALAEFRRRGATIARIETLGHNAVGSHLYPEVGFELMAVQNHYAMLLAE